MERTEPPSNPSLGTSPNCSLGPPPRRGRPTTFAPHAVRMLKRWFYVNQANPYPTEEQKLILGEQTGLTRKQIDLWFINSRRVSPNAHSIYSYFYSACCSRNGMAISLPHSLIVGCPLLLRPWTFKQRQLACRNHNFARAITFQPHQRLRNTGSCRSCNHQCRSSTNYAEASTSFLTN